MLSPEQEKQGQDFLNDLITFIKEKDLPVDVYGPLLLKTSCVMAISTGMPKNIWTVLCDNAYEYNKDYVRELKERLEKN